MYIQNSSIHLCYTLNRWKVLDSTFDRRHIRNIQEICFGPSEIIYYLSGSLAKSQT